MLKTEWIADRDDQLALAQQVRACPAGSATRFDGRYLHHRQVGVLINADRGSVAPATIGKHDPDARAARHHVGVREDEPFV